MAQFKVGDVVELVGNAVMNAPRGALATVTEVSDLFVYVKWDRTLIHDQQDGGYAPIRFRATDLKKSGG